MAEQTDVAALLADAEAERAELDVVIAHLRRKLGLAAGEAAGNGTTAPTSAGRDALIVAGRVRPDEFFRLSIGEAVMKYLAIMKQPQNPMAIVNGIKAGGILTNAKNFYANVNTELKRLRERDLIVNTPSGWGLAEWYPQRPRTPEPAKPKKKGRPKGAKGRAKPTTKNPTTKAPSEPHAPVQKQGGGWAAFAGEQIKAGKSMKEAAAAWKAMKAKEGAA